ncbi:MAG: DUF4136 domain-containing protein [Janthinobacterium lividum]
MKRARGCLTAMLVVLGLGLLGGCAGYVTTDVTAFQDWQGTDAQRTYAFAEKSSAPTAIEARTYQQWVADALSSYGFTRTDASHAHYVVDLAYRLRDTTVMIAQPVYYDSWPYGRGWFGPGPWGGPGPLWGPTFVDTPYPGFRAELRLRFYDSATHRELYEVTAQHTGTRAALATIMPYLVRSALADFPLPNGSVRRVSIRVDRNGLPTNDIRIGDAPNVAPLLAPEAAQAAKSPSEASASTP